MRIARVYVDKIPAGTLVEEVLNKRYQFIYFPEYKGAPVSLSMPVEGKIYKFDHFPPFFDGLLPEGIQLDGLLKQRKLDREDYFAQLMAVGADLVGVVTVEEERL
ncbi:MAG: HipA N-terminal domain-containing protein [Bacteroidota bacterium]|nr:HipA N-terminal domain-containing protein [Bacteroidota bacterium]